MNITHRERRFLELLAEEGATIAVGLRVGHTLETKGFVHRAKYKRLGITPAGLAALQGQAVKAPPPRKRQGPSLQMELGL